MPGGVRGGGREAPLYSIWALKINGFPANMAPGLFQRGNIPFAVAPFSGSPSR